MFLAVALLLRLCYSNSKGETRVPWGWIVGPGPMPRGAGVCSSY